MRCVRTALFLVLYRVIPSCHSWSFSPIAPSWGCPKGLKTKIWPELQLFCDYGLSQGVKAQIADQNRNKSVVEQSPSALQIGERSSQSQKSCKKAEIFVFTTRSCVVMQQKSGLSGWSARYFVSRETGRCVRIGFFGAVGTLLGNFERQGCRFSPTSIEGAPFMEGV